MTCITTAHVHATTLLSRGPPMLPSILPHRLAVADDWHRWCRCFVIKLNAGCRAHEEVPLVEQKLKDLEQLTQRVSKERLL